MFLRLASGSGRDILYGITRYSKRKCKWRLHIVDIGGGSVPDEIRRAAAMGVDGIIANGMGEFPDIADALRESNVPLAVVCAEEPDMSFRQNDVAYLRLDNEAIGRFGAKYLASFGRFRSYGFVARSEDARGTVQPPRERGFREALAGVSRDVRTYLTPAGVEIGSYEDIDALAKWLEAMPKPAAVMAAHDMRARMVVEAAETAGLEIPRDVSLVGVDNDELLCDAGEPALTSIAPDHVKLGELAAAALRKLMEKHCDSPIVSTLSSCTMVERQSAKPVAPAALLVERMSDFIAKNALKGANAADVAMRLGVSRRLADARFRQFTGESVLSAILKRRFDEIKRRLRETGAPIGKITAACGFRSENHAKELFRKRFGVSMSEYRRSSRQLSIQALCPRTALCYNAPRREKSMKTAKDKRSPPVAAQPPC